jgi:hypothetical protein
MIRRFFAAVREAVGKGFRWLGGALSESEGCPSSKRLFFFAAIVGALVFCGYDVAKHGGLTAQAIQLTETVLYITGAAYGVTRVFAEKSDGPPPQPRP